jgi:hypothetical protein
VSADVSADAGASSELPGEPTAGDGDSARDRDAWLAVLDDLEQAMAETAADPGSRPLTEDARRGPWSPPAGLGPLPADLADRAARLLRAQLDAESLLQDERARVARHLVAVRSVDPARPARESVYLDVLG